MASTINLPGHNGTKVREGQLGKRGVKGAKGLKGQGTSGGFFCCLRMLTSWAARRVSRYFCWSSTI